MTTRSRILVVGGAGYIGSHMSKMLDSADHDVVVVDNLSSGSRDALQYGQVIVGDIADQKILDRVFSVGDFDCVMHFASHIEVAESIQDPAKFYRNNVANSQALLDAMLRHGVKNFVFSSTAAIFGNPVRVPIDEFHPKNPINPYGRTKWMVEQMLADYETAYGVRSVSLRYFNAAGADPDGDLGERHEPETHLIPLILQAATGERDSISIFGTDYDTPDGTAVRDFIHVVDLCEAHLLAMDYLKEGGESAAFNLGNGRGFSVREVVDVARRVTGQAFTVREKPRRLGDPARLVADATSARDVLGWTPRRSELEEIIRDAWRFQCARRRR